MRNINIAILCNQHIYPDLSHSDNIVTIVGPLYTTTPASPSNGPHTLQFIDVAHLVSPPPYSPPPPPPMVMVCRSILLT